VTEDVHAEAEGSNAEEARANVLAEIRRKAPWVDEQTISVQIVDEGERGLLGIGSHPARAVAYAQVPDRPSTGESEIVSALGEFADLVTRTIAPDSRAEATEEKERTIIRFSGGDLGILIGRRGQTIEAIEQLANAIVRHQAGPDAKRVTADAGGYRDRQKAALSYAALQAAKRAISSGEPQALEPMTSVERKIVHERLKDYEGVTTTSEGTDLNRHVVVVPADASGA
jgi:spoIIIJ-associated protein